MKYVEDFFLNLEYGTSKAVNNLDTKQCVQAKIPASTFKKHTKNNNKTKNEWEKEEEKKP